MPLPQLTDDMPFYIVLNPKSGSRDAQEARTQICSIIEGVGRKCEFLVVQQPRDLSEIARQAAHAAVRNHGVVVAAGGDGTINCVAHATLPTHRPFGILPLGTFNYSSRAHGIPLETEAAARALLNARIKPVQVGALNERIFLVNASLGLYPEVLQDREHYKRLYGRKRIVAMWSAFATITRGYSSLTLDIEHDGERDTVRTPTLFVGNNPLQLEQIGLPEAEDVQRRRLAAVMVKPVGARTLLWLALRGAMGKLGEEDRVRNFSFREMTVRPHRLDARRGAKIATDGEVVWLAPPLYFRVAPDSLYLLVPA
jgi:diacylglycerol kinase family enzyme